MIFRSKTKREDLSAFGEGHILELPSTWHAGVVFTSPHSGNIYPSELLKHSELTSHQYRRNEDIFIDDLFHGVINAGAPFLRATFPRLIVDVNRAPTELPEHWSDIIKKNEALAPTPRALAGLGVIPTYLSKSLPIYEKLPNKLDVKQRLSKLYHPYHDKLKDLLVRTKSQFGQALLVDCHSMPGFAPMGARRPDIILGDRFGTSCHPNTLEQFKSLFSDAGYSVGINYPYAGGYTTSHYGSPSEGVEAIQIEINRDLYVNEITQKRKSGYSQLKADIDHITKEIIDFAHPQDLAAQ